MDKKAEKQLKELRRLMPWCWDARVEEHPPGEKALHDFGNVINYDLESSRTRPQKPGIPIAAPSTKLANQQHKANNKPQINAGQRLSPEPGPLPVDDNDSNKPVRPALTSEKEPPPSTARHVGRDSGPTPAGGRHKATPAVGRKTPATHLKATATPQSIPSSSRLKDGSTTGKRYNAALADGQFFPTPGDTPLTVIGTKQSIATAQKQGAAKNDSTTNKSDMFKSPAPRTVFTKKRLASTTTAAGRGKEVKPAASLVQGQYPEEDSSLQAKHSPDQEETVVKKNRGDIADTTTTLTEEEQHYDYHAAGGEEYYENGGGDYVMDDANEDDENMHANARHAAVNASPPRTYNRGQRSHATQPSGKKVALHFAEDEDDDQYEDNNDDDYERDEDYQQPAAAAKSNKRRAQSQGKPPRPSKAVSTNLLPGSQLHISRPKGPAAPMRPSKCPPLFKQASVPSYKENVSLAANMQPLYFSKERGLVNLVQGGLLNTAAAAPTHPVGVNVVQQQKQQHAVTAPHPMMHPMMMHLAAQQHKQGHAAAGCMQPIAYIPPGAVPPSLVSVSGGNGQPARVGPALMAAFQMMQQQQQRQM